MKLEPVYLAKPRPAQPEPRNSRRAFLLASCWFTGGVLVGGACGVSLGGSGEENDDLAPSGDAQLDEFRRLAVAAPIDELMAARGKFVVVRQRRYPTDPVLWRGMVRISDALIIDEKLEQRRQFAAVLVPMIEKGAPPKQLHLDERLDALRQIARGSPR